ncbi:hypothetical protein BDU57DRAFT_536163 [Ampelomyces quisqualis]|uniref:Uncharacterized protein n=1 Tax=Ampelomyces quisqualis TaxID=50730 RepID=A0A6A5QWE3_AMPQU|nr:hypothetical protein BDU57DRAFT_536163 [Ampelomyces quisqualis]
MDDSHSAPLGTQEGSATKILPLLRGHSGSRPYQAYCVTEPSRTPTPDPLTPEPLRIRSSLAGPHEDEPRNPPSNAIVRALAVRFQLGGITTFQEQKDEEHGRKLPPNEGSRSRSTMLAIDHHITQAATPRGSHPLTTSKSTVCDRTPSHLRMQQTTQTYGAISPKYRRKPLPQHANISTMERHPLPPLPLEPIPNAEVHDIVPKRALCQSPTPFRAVDDQNKTYFASTQLPSADELYTPRGFLSDIEDFRRAPRRTQPKDAKFRYQFGRRPSIRFDNPPPTPPHRSAPITTNSSQPNQVGDHSIRDNYFAPLSLSSNLVAKVDTQLGPRPPPWGSTDNLEMRRQTRSDAREREDARKYRLTADSGSSLYKGSDSTDSLRENTMRREVEEYREQVLRIYPDMEFNGRAGEGGRRRCCCVVM